MGCVLDCAEAYGSVCDALACCKRRCAGSEDDSRVLEQRDFGACVVWLSCLRVGRFTVHDNRLQLAQKPEDKFRHINMENRAFQQRVAAKRGGLKFLTAAGFVKDDDGRGLVSGVCGVGPCVSAC